MKASSSSVGRLLLRSLLLFALLLLVPRPAAAEGTFISAPGRVDMVHDLNRNILYISRTVKTWNSTTGQQVITQSEVVRYNTATNTYLSPIPIYGDLMGLDLSPDGNTLLVADQLHATDKLWVHQVDLQTLTVRKVEFPRDPGWLDGGTFAIAFGNDGAALITARFHGSGWTPLRRYHPATGVWSVVASVNQNSMVSASADGNYIALAESNSSDGPHGRFRVVDGSSIRRSGYELGTSWFNYEVGISRNGMQYAVPTYGGTYIYNQDALFQTKVGVYAYAQPIGVAYHPFQDIVYFAWADWQNPSARYVKAHRTTDFAVVGQFDFENQFDHPGNHAFQEGRLRIARDGSLLFGTVNNGVRFVRLGAGGLVATPQTVRTNEDLAVPVTLSGSGNGGDLQYEVLTTPEHGVLTGSAPNLLYIPPPNYGGIDRFTFRVTGGGGVSQPATVNLVVNPVNDVPSFLKGLDETVVSNGARTYFEWATQISAGPPEEAGQTLTFIVSTDNPALFATLPAIDAKGTLTYTPKAGAAGTAVVTVRLRDNGGTAFGGVDTSPPQTFTITVTAESSNQPPTAQADAVTIAEDTTADIAVLANDSDPDADALTISSVTQPTSGTAQINGAQITYTPKLHFNGTTSFNYTISDGKGGTATATVTVTLTPVNDPPAAANVSRSVNEDGRVLTPLQGSDVDNDPLTYTIVSGPAHGTLTGTLPADLFYSPSPNYNGPDSFTYKVNDGKVDSAVATFTLNVLPVNDPPAARPDAVTTAEDTSVTIDVLANDRDVDGDALTLASATQSNNGVVTISEGKLTYRPRLNFHGTDSITYTVRDAQGATATGVVTITITPVNDLPVVSNQDLSVAEDTPATLTLRGTDVDNDPLTFSIVTGPANGTLTGTAPNLTYTPAPNFSGVDRFTFKANDGTGDSNVATMVLSVRPVNDAPVAGADSATTPEETPVTVNVLANDSDADGNPLTLTAVSQPSNGAAVINAGQVVYTPNANFSGSDSFTYSVSDGQGGTATGMVTIRVTPVNDPPTAAGQDVALDEDGSAPITLGAADADGDPLTFSIASGPAHGTLSGTAPNLTYRPAPNFAGADSFTFKVNDGAADSAVATVTLTVRPVNDAPVAGADAAATPEETAVTLDVLANDTDADGNPLSIASVTQGANGTVQLNGGQVVYTPNVNFAGSDTFTYVVSDGQGGTATGRVTVTVSPVNDAPTAGADTATASKNTAINIAVLTNDSDVDGDTLRVTSVTAAANGTVAINTDGTLRYTPRKNYFGTDTFRYTVSDGKGGTATATVTVTVLKR